MKRVLSQLGTFGIVTVFTLLVWLYAEDANIVEYTDQPVRLQFVVPDNSDGRVTPARSFTVQVDFNGSNGQFQQFIAQTREEVISVPLPLTMDQDYQTQDVGLRSLLEESELRKMGINITDVRPPTVTVSYEKNIDVPIGVPQLEASGVDLAEPARITQAEPVYVRNLPAGRRDELNGVTALVRLRPEDVAGLPRGVERQIVLPVTLYPAVEGLTPVPASVAVLVKRANDLDRVTIDRRAVLLSYPSSINERYIVSINEADRIINAFELEGPRAAIEQLKADPSSPLVWASVRLTNEDADQAAAGDGTLTKQVEIIAPPGVVQSSEFKRVTVLVQPRPVAP